MPIDAFVFDLVGVLVDVDFRRAIGRWAAAAGVPAGHLAGRFRRDEAYCAHERGEMDDARYFAHLRSSLDLQIDHEEMLGGWNAVLGEPLPGVEALVRHLAGELPLYVFSNTNPAHIAHFKPRYRALLSHFRTTFTSCDVGARKPETEAFARVAGRIGAAPSRLAFFDDLEENVAGAARAGFQAFHVSSAEEIAAIAEALLAVRKAR